MEKDANITLFSDSWGTSNETNTKSKLYSWTTPSITTIPQNESCREDGRSREAPYVPYHVDTLVPIGKADKIHSTLGDPTTL